jgi:amino acid transporter
VTHFLGKGVAYFATVLICLVILGSLLGNSFVVGRMTVAASNKNWLPGILGTVGQIGPWKISRSVADDNAEDAMDKGESPM